MIFLNKSYFARFAWGGGGCVCRRGKTVTDFLKVWDIHRKRAIFYRDDFPLERKFSGVGVDFSAEILHGGYLDEFKYKFAHSPHEK